MRHGVGGWRYAFFLFPDEVEPRQVLDALDAALSASGRWGVNGPPGLVEHRTWTHPASDQRIGAVVVGFRPLLLSVGPRQPAGRVRGSTPADGLAAPDAVRDALVTVQQAALRLRGRELSESQVLPLVQQAQRWFEMWVRHEHRVAELRAGLDARLCPSCGRQVAFDARSCGGCGHRFTAADDLKRDTDKESATTELGKLESTGPGGANAQPPVFRPVGRR